MIINQHILVIHFLIIKQIEIKDYVHFLKYKLKIYKLNRLNVEVLMIEIWTNNKNMLKNYQKNKSNIMRYIQNIMNQFKNIK